MDKTLYYNYLEKCDNEEFYDETIYNNFTKKEDIYSESEDSDGFSFEYEFTIDDDKYKAFMIQYKNFTGNELTMYYDHYSETQTIIIAVSIIVGFVAFTISLSVSIVKICDKYC